VGDLVYVYAVLESTAGDVQLAGIDEQPVRFLRNGPLAAAVSDVPAADFDEAPLNERVRDMAWLGPRAVAHQAVSATLHEQLGGVLPLQFGSLFLDDERVRGYLRANEADLVRRLGVVRGRSEYVVAVHREAEPTDEELLAGSPRLRELQADVDASTPGRAYLLKQRLAEARRDAADEVDAQVVDAALSELRGAADAVLTESVPADAEDRPLVRASLLVRDAAVLEEAIARLEARGLRLIVTGPWPPYRFAASAGA
jgi:hypothetical protein